MSARSLASLSLDLDNEWSYLKTHGDETWTTFPSYLSTVVPHLLAACDRHGLTITVFVVGQDADVPANREPLATLGESRHEIGNHSFHHEPWLHLKDRTEVGEELRRAHDAIEAATGRAPDGFRGPGFSLSDDTLAALGELGYRYDASTLPTFIGPLARAYYFRGSDLDEEERERRSLLFGSFNEVFRPLRPYRWAVPGGELVEIPVTTMPLLRVPIHVSYVLYLAEYSEAAARTYFRTALALCRLRRVEPSILLHPLDLLGGDEVPSLSFFPAMGMTGVRKRRLLDDYLGILADGFDVVPMGRHLEALEKQGVPARPTRPTSGVRVSASRSVR